MGNSSSQIIGDGIVRDNTVVQVCSIKYIYCGNSKMAMIQVIIGKEQTYYVFNNLQGTPEFITDEHQQLVQIQQTDAYGNVEKLIGTLSDEITYTGKKLDQETGFYYFNQRYYDPELGRFLSEDPEGQMLNPYQYCANSPLMYTDPDGQLFFFDDILIAACWAGATATAAKFADNLYHQRSNDLEGLWGVFKETAWSSVKAQTGIANIEKGFQAWKQAAENLKELAKMKLPGLDLGGLKLPDINISDVGSRMMQFGSLVIGAPYLSYDIGNMATSAANNIASMSQGAYNTSVEFARNARETFGDPRLQPYALQIAKDNLVPGIFGEVGKQLYNMPGTAKVLGTVSIFIDNSMNVYDYGNYAVHYTKTLMKRIRGVKK